MGDKGSHEHQEEAPRRHLPEIGEKPIVTRRRRWGRIAMLVSGAVFVTASCIFRFLQHHEPGPKYEYIPPPAVTTLASLAIKKGFPQECLKADFIDPFDTSPDTSADPNVEKLACIYAGHPDGQPIPDEPCVVVLERNTWSDPYNFGFTVVGADGAPRYLGKGSQFSDIAATTGLPSACVQENITYP